MPQLPTIPGSGGGGGAGGDVNLLTINGNTPDTGSGNKSTGTLRVVLATDQPALTNKLLVTPDLPSGASTAAKQPALGTAGTASTDVISIQGIASMTKLLVTPDSVALPANQSVNVAQINGVTPLMGAGNTGTGSARVTIATDQVAIPVSQATGTNLHTVIDSGTVTTVSTVTSLSQLAGTAIAMNTGVRAAGVQRVTIATDDVVPASQSGTWTVQPGNTANTTAWLMTRTASTPSKLVSASGTNATSLKGSAGTVYAIIAFNLNASPRYLKLYNKATAPTVGSDTPVQVFMIPGNAAGAGFALAPDCGIAFSTGIAYALTTGITDADTGAVAASEIVVNINYI